MNNHLGFIDDTAFVPDSTPVWHGARVLAMAVVGAFSSIGGGTEIGRGTRVGDRSRISAMVFLPPNSRIGNDVFIGPGCIFTDDRYPRTLKAGETYIAEPPVVDDDASVGAGCVILPGVRIGRGATIGAGSVITRDVPPLTHWRGEPARQKALSGASA